MGGSSSTPQPQSSTVTQTNLPEYAQPYFSDIMAKAQAASNAPYQTYTDANGQPIQRIADLNAAQIQANQGVMGEGTTGFSAAKDMTQQAGLAALNAGNYQGGQFSAQQVNPYNAQGVANVQNQNISGAGNVQAQQYNPYGANMQAAQSNYNPQLTTFQIGAPQNFGQDQAQQYMSPYVQNVLDTTMAQNLRNAKQDQLAGNLNAGRLGTLGGSRQLIASTERERNLGQLQSQTEAQGMQSAYENAQQQFERDRQAGLGVASQNLQSAQATQALGTQTGMQMALANLSSQQQANVQNQAAYLQTQGLNASQAMQAALANQQTQQQTQQFNASAGLQAALANQQSGLQTQGLNAAQSLQAQMANQQMGMTAQQAAEQSRQFGANLGLQGLAQATQSAQTLGGLAGAQQQADLARYQAQSAVGSQEQQHTQQLLDQQYADFLRQQEYPMEQLGYFSNILHGVPVGLAGTSTTYAQPPSLTSQVGGLGLGAASLAQLMKG